MQRFLKGKTLDGQTSPVKAVQIKGDQRIIKLASGETFSYSKSKALEAFHAQLNEHQRSKAAKSIRVLSGNVVRATIGGERRTYQTTSTAKAAISRYYNRGYSK